LSIFIGMKLVKLYESVLREGDAEACVSKFGKILFADQLGGDEKNTNIEDKHLDALYNFTDSDFGRDTNPYLIKAVNNLRNCMDMYPEVLKPDGEMVYRGTCAPVSWFINNGAIPTKKSPQPYEYRSKNHVQSWTNDSYVAGEFSGKHNLNDFCRLNKVNYDDAESMIPRISKTRIPVVLEYKATEKDFLFKSKYFNILSDISDEHEVLRVENSPIMVMAYLNTQWLSLDAERLLVKINEML
jgi:hypothetical protein